jgi:hypothetical protein
MRWRSSTRTSPQTIWPRRLGPAGRFSVQFILWDNGPWGTEGTMKKTRFSEEQMVKILREADSTPVSEVTKRHGVSDVTI